MEPANVIKSAVGTVLMFCDQSMGYIKYNTSNYNAGPNPVTYHEVPDSKVYALIFTIGALSLNLL